MQSLSATRPTASPPQKRDPAPPSRVAYKVHRLWLTPPFVRQLTRVGLPVFAVTMAAGVYLADSDRREALMASAQEMRRAVEERPEFMVKLMVVEGATPPVVDDAIRQLMPIDFPISSFDLDLEAMQSEVAALDVIERVDLRVRPGGVLEVKVREREPVVLWRTAASLEMLDGTGHRVATISSRAGRADLPLLAGAGGPRTGCPRRWRSCARPARCVASCAALCVWANAAGTWSLRAGNASCYRKTTRFRRWSRCLPWTRRRSFWPAT